MTPTDSNPSKTPPLGSPVNGSESPLARLIEVMKAFGVKQLYAKALAPNDNSKNQIYLGGALNVLPVGPGESARSSRGAIFKAPLNFFWLGPDEALHKAPGAQLILYPQYPEVRLSGFLRGCRNAPAALLTTRTPDRILFLGVAEGPGVPERRIIGHVVAPGSTLADAVKRLDVPETVAVFKVIPLGRERRHSSYRDVLLRRLRAIHGSGERWFGGRRLDGDGNLLERYNAPNAGGYTLEALFGITPNGSSDPDFADIELKVLGQNRVITLMTPEPRRGLYAFDIGDFLQEFGTFDAAKDRWYFTGIHRVSEQHPNTGLRLALQGYEPSSGPLGELTDPEGGLALITEDGRTAAFWPFSIILEHWSNKHRHSAYVQCRSRRAADGRREYAFGPEVGLAEAGSPLLLLRALAEGVVYYDPAVKLENFSGDRWRYKKRNQFRARAADLPRLYAQHAVVSLARAE